MSLSVRVRVRGRLWLCSVFLAICIARTTVPVVARIRLKACRRARIQPSLDAIKSVAVRPRQQRIATPDG